MSQLSDKNYLESKFADDFGSPYFPVLAELYFKVGQFQRAQKVCELGLDQDRGNTDGKFILAKIALVKEKFTTAEQFLKQIVDENPLHIVALKLLVKLEFHLNRSPNTIRNYINRIFEVIPNDDDGAGWMSILNATKGKIVESVEESPEIASSPKEDKMSSADQPAKPAKEPGYPVTPSMATFTMVKILSSQKHYDQALGALDILETKGGDKMRVAKEKEEIESLLAAVEK